MSTTSTIPARARSLRAFTLLETVLATLIGSMFVLITVGLIYTMQRADLAMSRRADETSDLYRARIVMERCFSTVLTSEQAPPPKPDAARKAAGRSVPSDPKLANGAPDDLAPDAAPPIPRVILTSQSSPGAAPVRLASGEVSATSRQRLEIVVFESPVPSSFRRSPRAGAASSSSNEPESDVVEPIDDPDAPLPDATEDIPLKAIRGALELRPMPFDEDDLRDSRPPGYELWWVPLPRRAPADSVLNEALQAELSSIDQPYRVASNIADLKWRFYDDRKKKTVFEATWDFQLPAYIECEIETRSGLRGEWMFEVGWGVGPEVRTPKPEATENRATPVDDGGRRPNTVTPPAPISGQPKSGGGGVPKGRPK